ncbi:MAG: YigZ family protein [Candidatus Cloacimonadota bacterium]|nr:YigZ family protein [Candidatus Cloacimonadota bacterium]
MEYFYSIKKNRNYRCKIKRSEFIAHLAYVETIEEAKEFISQISEEHKTATHNCWAYIVGEKGKTYHCSDAGEPSGTAGKPILNALKKNNMTNIAAVVTRYFGGVKLGIPGLIEAYGKTTEAAVKKSPLKKLIKTVDFQFSTTYEFIEPLKYNIKEKQGKITDIKYGADVKLVVEVEHHLQKYFQNYLQEMEKAGKLKLN